MVHGASKESQYLSIQFSIKIQNQKFVIIININTTAFDCIWIVYFSLA